MSEQSVGRLRAGAPWGPWGIFGKHTDVRVLDVLYEIAQTSKCDAAAIEFADVEQEYGHITDERWLTGVMAKTRCDAATLGPLR